MIKSTSASRYVALLSVGILAVTLSGCSAATTTTTPDTAAGYTAAECSADSTSADTLKVGTILPITGNLSFLNPPELAGAGLAVADINAAGGVNGSQACILATDSGDSTDLTVSTASASTLVDAGVSVVIGAASSSVSLNVVDTFTAAKIVQISGANTAATLSGYSPFYFRTAPPDTVQGSALGQLVTGDGNANVAFLVFNDTYGTGLRDSTQGAIEASGGTIVYGGTGTSQEFPAGQTTFSSEVTAAISSNPDAIVILAFDETKAIVPELVAQGWDMSKVYLSDGNTSDYSEVFEAGTLTGAQGTIPGAQANDAFKAELVKYFADVEGGELKDFSYGPETYDAVILAALAAVKGGATDSETIQANMAAVSGANGGEVCSTYADCIKLIADGKDIEYQGNSGVGPFNANNDPSSAFIGIFTYDETNAYVFQSAIEGAS
jgi:neutral amino acid transport system substrate-binding protein